MEDYKTYYAILCGAISQALDLLKPLPVNALAIQALEQALLKTEAMYIEAGET